MREIEFRAWNTQEKRYYYGVEHAYDYTVGCSKTGDFIPATSFGEIAECDGSEWIPEQYTGFKDKHNVEIYEGDIVKSTVVLRFDDEVREVIGEVFYYKDASGFLFGRKDDNVEVGLMLSLSEQVEVIGNINENPELLINK